MPRKPRNDPKAGQITKQIVEKVKAEEARRKGKPPEVDEVLREKIRDSARNIVQRIEDVGDIDKLNACLKLIAAAEVQL